VQLIIRCGERWWFGLETRLIRSSFDKSRLIISINQVFWSPGILEQVWNSNAEKDQPRDLQYSQARVTVVSKTRGLEDANDPPMGSKTGKNFNHNVCEPWSSWELYCSKKLSFQYINSVGAAAERIVFSSHTRILLDKAYIARRALNAGFTRRTRHINREFTRPWAHKLGAWCSEKIMTSTAKFLDYSTILDIRYIRSPHDIESFRDGWNIFILWSKFFDLHWLRKAIKSGKTWSRLQSRRESNERKTPVRGLK
jgi:hypothetical protein